MKNYSIYFSILTVLLFITSSCKKDFLDVSDNSFVLRQEYVKDIATTNDYLNGIYVGLGRDFYSGFINIYPDLIADNIKPRSSSLSSHYNWAQIVDNNTTNMSSTWSSGYQFIRSCSFVLEKSKDFKSQHPGMADNIMAQAYALRAFGHFLLVNFFAQSYNFTAEASHPGIPYITTSDWTQPFSRQTVAEVYTEMITDLENAIDLFSSSSVNPLFFNRNAAKALLARVYLFKGDYTNAKNMAVDIMKEVPIMSATDYPSKLFTDKDPEALFQIPPASTVAGSSYNVNLQGRYFIGSSSQVRFLATADIAELLTADPMDKRKAWITTSTLGKTITKYPKDVVPGFNPTSNSYYQTILRSSEMCLTAAEAYANLNNTDSAWYYLDAIRQRANPAAVPTTANGTALLDSIYLERRKELAFEGLRMFDLLRWKKGVTRLDPVSPSVASLPYPSEKAIAPIPAPDVTIASLPQNPGY